MDDVGDQLVRIDTSTGIGTIIGGDIGPNIDEGALAISSDGTAVFSDEDGDTYLIDLLAGTASFIGDSDVDTDNLAFIGTTLFGIDRFDDDLYTIDISDATPTLVGSLGINTSTQHGLTYDPASGTLYFVEGGGDIFSVNPNTGASTFIATSSLGFTNLAIRSDASVPAPASAALVFLGVLAMISRRRNRRTS